jgi:hypothetical protein
MALAGARPGVFPVALGATAVACWTFCAGRPWCWLPKEVGMFARVTVVEVPPGQFDKARQLLNTAAERTRGLRGHRASYWLGDPKTGRLVTVALYNTQDEVRASADKVAAWKEELIPQAGGRLVSVEEYEVLIGG